MNQTRRMRRGGAYGSAWRLGLMFLGILAMCGCRSGRETTYPVSGVVRFEGQPLTDCRIMFRPEQGPVASGRLDEEGRFQLSTYGSGDGAVAGVHRVWLAPPETEFDMSDDELEFGQDASRLRKPPPFPAKYLSFATSELTADVQAEANEFEFVLKP
ncbi:MAG: hypothetical protein ACOCWL_00185 [Thermoguttaceae bacterium]